MSGDVVLNRINRQSTTDAIETAQEMSRTTYVQEEAMGREEQRQIEAALAESRKLAYMSADDFAVYKDSCVPVHCLEVQDCRASAGAAAARQRLILHGPPIPHHAVRRQLANARQRRLWRVRCEDSSGQRPAEGWTA